MDSYGITVLGMGTVFLALIALSLILTLFPLIFRRRGKQIKDPAPLPIVSSTAASTPAPSKAELGAELVAVLAAAVAAASGMEPGRFRITEIQGAASGGFSTPAWGHVDRLTRSPFAAR
jgi:sodium pump decarboxylase gamma subunit